MSIGLRNTTCLFFIPMKCFWQKLVWCCDKTRKQMRGSIVGIYGAQLQSKPVPTSKWLATGGVTNSNGTDAGLGDVVQTWSASIGPTGSTTQWTPSGVLANVTMGQSATGKRGVRFMGNVVLAVPDAVMTCTTPLTIFMAFQWTQPLTTWVNILGKGQSSTLHFYVDPANQYLWLRPNYTSTRLFIESENNKQFDKNVWHWGSHRQQPLRRCLGSCDAVNHDLHR